MNTKDNCNSSNVFMSGFGVFVFFVTWPILSIYVFNFENTEWSMFGGLAASIILGVIATALVGLYQEKRENKASLKNLARLAHHKGLISHAELSDTDIFENFPKETARKLYYFFK